MIFDYETLKFIWWVLVGVLFIGFAITDGMDMGDDVMRSQMRPCERHVRQIPAQGQRAGRGLFDRALEAQHARRHGIVTKVARRAAHLASGFPILVPP
jgi:hypothetical protein